MRPSLAALLYVAMEMTARAQTPTLRIRVLDYAGVPAATLGSFPLPASEVFRQSGIASEWPTCRIQSRQGACEPLADSEVYVKIVRQPAPGGPTKFGTTIRQGSRGLFAYVFWVRVEQAARHHGVAPSLLLAHVIAHEAGHLLGLDHAAAGIMQCEFGGPEILGAGKGMLRFTVDEGAALRDALGVAEAALHPAGVAGHGANH